MKKPVIMVSECLLGFPCRYKGDDCRCDAVTALAERATLVGICPEQMGGLPTPRDPAEIVGDAVISNHGRDVTEQYQRGAQAALALAVLNGATLAVLKAKSPSCGKGLIYDGSFTGRKIPGDGVTAKLFAAHGIRVFTEEEIPALLALLDRDE